MSIRAFRSVRRLLFVGGIVVCLGLLLTAGEKGFLNSAAAQQRQGPVAKLYIQKNVQGAKGATIEVPVILSQSDGLDAADIAITYDATRLGDVKVKLGPLAQVLLWSSTRRRRARFVR